MGGSSKKVTVGYKYYAGEHMVLCHGPIDKVSEIYVDNRLAWEGGVSDGQINVDAPSLFGGESREGGVSGLVDIEMGAPAQNKNSYLQSILGDAIPAFRGVVSAVLRQCYLGNNPYLKPWSFKAKRIHVTGRDGSVQWYDEKAEVFNAAQRAAQQEAVDFQEQVDEWIESFGDNWSEYFDYSVHGGAGATSGNGLQPFGSTNDSQTYVESICEREIWQSRIITIPAFAARHQVTMEFLLVSDDGGQALWDGFGAPANSYDAGVVRRHEITIPHDWCTVGDHLLLTKIKNCRADDFVTEYGSDFDIYSRLDFVSISAVALPDEVFEGDMNPAHILRETITDGVWGIQKLISMTITLWNRQIPFLMRVWVLVFSGTDLVTLRRFKKKYCGTSMVCCGWITQQGNSN